MRNKKQGKLLYGNVTNDGAMYIWNAEPGACEKCQALDGKVYEDANEIPDKPHPNCKCWIDIRKKESDDPIQQRRDDADEQKALDLEFQKLQGDLKCLEDECNANIDLIDKELETIEEFEYTINPEYLKPLDVEGVQEKSDNSVTFTQSSKIQDNAKQQLNEVKNELNESKILLRGQVQVLNNIKNVVADSEKEFQQDTHNNISKLKSKLYELKTQLVQTEQFVNRIMQKINQVSKKLEKNIETFLIRYSPQPLLDKLIKYKGGKLNAEDGAAFWLISSNKFEGDFVEDYIKRNGYMYDSISDIGDSKLENFVRKKLYDQVNESDARGVVYKPTSSVSQAIIKSKEIKDFIAKNKNSLLNNRRLTDTSLAFETGNLFYAYYHADICNIHLDDDNNFKAIIIDTYDFNKGETNELVKRGRELQLAGEIEVYFNVALINIPYKEWIHY